MSRKTMKWIVYIMLFSIIVMTLVSGLSAFL